MPTSPTPLLIVPVRVVLESDALIFFLKKLHQLLSWETYSKVMSLLTYEHRIYILRQSQLLSPDPGSFLWSLIMAMNLQHWGDC